MRYLFIVIQIFVVLTASRTFAADACAGGYAQLAGSAHPTSTVHRIEDLDPAVQRWLQWRQAELGGLRAFQTKVGQELTVNGQKHKVVGLLGKGAEGVVYLVQTPLGLRTAKVFETPQAFEQGIASVAKHDTWADFPKILENDAKNRVSLMEYIEGIPLNEIRSDFSEFRLDYNERRRILELWHAEIQRLEAITPGDIVVFEKNVVFSFREGRFRVIDPH